MIRNVLTDRAYFSPLSEARLRRLSRVLRSIEQNSIHPRSMEHCLCPRKQRDLSLFPCPAKLCARRVSSSHPKSSWLLRKESQAAEKICFQGVFRDRDLPLRDRRQGWKREGQGAPRGRGASCCVSHSQLILSGRSTCSTLSAAPSPWRHDPNKSSNRLQRVAV